VPPQTTSRTVCFFALNSCLRNASCIGQTARRPLARALAACLLLSIVLLSISSYACGGGDALPASPSTQVSPDSPAQSVPTMPPSGPQPPRGFAVSLDRVYDPVVQMSWSRVRFSWLSPVSSPEHSSPTSYVLEISSSIVSGEVIFAHELPAIATSYAWLPPLTGTLYARIISRSDTGSASSEYLPVVLPDFHDVAEALVLGTGRHEFSGNPGCSTEYLNGWPAGSTIEIIAAASLSDAERRASADAAEAFRRETGGAFHISVRSSQELEPTPQTGKIVVKRVDAQNFTTRCPTASSGCAPMGLNTQGLIRWAEVLLLGSITGDQVGGVYHELGHALAGLCHIGQGDNPPVAQNMSAMTGAREFTEVDLGVVRAVYGAGLRPGATRSQLAAAGVIR
jgi:hypothetical protein